MYTHGSISKILQCHTKSEVHDKIIEKSKRRDVAIVDVIRYPYKSCWSTHAIPTYRVYLLCDNFYDIVLLLSIGDPCM